MNRGNSRHKDYLREYLAVAPTSLALERSIECRELSSLGFEHPVMDLGCGDGIFGSVFYDAQTFADVGVDLSIVELVRAQRSQIYPILIAGSASALPVPSAYFKTVLANSVLEHIPNLSDSLREIARVLDEHGSLFMTVPTPDYEQMFFWTRVLRTVHLRGLSGLYCRVVNKMFRHYHVYPPIEWISRIEAAGMSVVSWKYYLSPMVVALDDLLCPLVIVNLVIKAMRGRWILFPTLRRPISSLLAFFWRAAYQSRSDRGGYVLIQATCSKESVNLAN